MGFFDFIFGDDDPPPAPDYAAAAKATAAGSLDAARFAAEANRVNQITPYGSLIYTKGAPPSMPNVGTGGLYTTGAQPSGLTGGLYNVGGSYRQPSPDKGYGQPGGVQPATSAAWDQEIEKKKFQEEYWTTHPKPINAVQQDAYSKAFAAASVAGRFTQPKQTTGQQGVSGQQGPTATENTWTAYQTLSPVEQAKLDQQNSLSMGLLGTAGKGLSQVDQMLSDTRLDESRLAQMGISGQSVQDAILSRLTPELDRQQAGIEQQMANQGIPRGSEAWNQAMQQQSQRRNDLMTQAALQGIETANRSRQQGISEQYTAQSRPLDILNALRTGAQVQNPTFVNVPQQSATAGADLLGAAQGQYNAQMGQYNAEQASNQAMMGGLFGLGTAALGGPMGASLGSMFSSGGGSGGLGLQLTSRLGGR